jgi:hypothetical protein
VPGLPAKCSKCGFEFEGRGIFIEGTVTNVQLWNNTESCPRCGGRARIIEGTFNVRDGVVEVLRATASNRILLSRFADVAKLAQAGSLDQEEAISQIAEESPEIRSLLERVPERFRQIFIWVLLQAIVVLAAQGVSELRDNSATPGDVQRIVHQYERSERHAIQVAVDDALKEYHERDPGHHFTSGQGGELKPRRNAPCACGSGRKYKKCCGR